MILHNLVKSSVWAVKFYNKLLLTNRMLGLVKKLLFIKYWLLNYLVKTVEFVPNLIKREICIKTVC